jgi:chloride channel protein, CIC family
MLKTQRRQHGLIVDTVLLGVAAALSARAFVFLLQHCQELFLGWMAGYYPPAAAADGSIAPQAVGVHGLWLVPLATTLGGLLSGLLVYSLAPESEGHGTDTVVNAFHNMGGLIRARVPFVKLVASAITIGSGGSAGREGPTALISAGIGSIYATRRGLSEEDTRLLLVVGMAAGLSAIFRSPIGTAIFAVEVLYGEMEFEAGALVFTMLGSIVAYAVNGFFVGFRPLFEVPSNLGSPAVGDYGWYAVLGIFSGLVGTALPIAFYGVRDLFHRLPCPPHFKPALGGLGVGLIALFLPQLLGGGYGWIQEAIDGRLATSVLLLWGFGKILTFALTIGSGGSGGVFAPTLFTGAMLGGFLGQTFHQPGAPFVVVGMAAVFGAAARVPIATLLMVTEMTGGYHLLVAAALAVMLSSLVQNLLSSSLKYKSLYEAQVPTRPYSPSHYVEQLRIALDLLRTHDGSAGPQGRRLELISLLASGVPVSLPGGKQLRIGLLRSKSPCVGRAIDSPCLGGSSDEVEFILVLRRKRTIFPHRGLILEAEDQLVVIASDGGWAALRDKLESVADPHAQLAKLREERH